MPCKHLYAVYFSELKGKQVHSLSTTFGLQFHKPNNFVNLFMEVSIDVHDLLDLETYIAHLCVTGSPLIVRFLGPRKNRTNGNPYY